MQLGAHLGEHAPAELGHLPGDGQVGDHRYLGAVAVRGHGGGDDGAGVALAPGVAPGRLQHDPPGRLVALDEGGLALVLGGDRADLDLDDTAVLVALDLLELGARAASGRSAPRRSGPSTPRGPRHPPGTRWSAPCRQILSGVDVGRVALARYLADQVRPLVDQHPGALVARRRQEIPHRRGQTDRVAALPIVGGDGDRARPARGDRRPRLGRDSGWSPRPTTRASRPAWRAACDRHLQRGGLALGPARVVAAPSTPSGQARRPGRRPRSRPTPASDPDADGVGRRRPHQRAGPATGRAACGPRRARPRTGTRRRRPGPRRQPRPLSSDASPGLTLSQVPVDGPVPVAQRRGARGRCAGR